MSSASAVPQYVHDDCDFSVNEQTTLCPENEGAFTSDDENTKTNSKANTRKVIVLSLLARAIIFAVFFCIGYFGCGYMLKCVRGEHSATDGSVHNLRGGYEDGYTSSEVVVSNGDVVEEDGTNVSCMTPCAISWIVVSVVAAAATAITLGVIFSLQGADNNAPSTEQGAAPDAEEGEDGSTPENNDQDSPVDTDTSGEPAPSSTGPEQGDAGNTGESLTEPASATKPEEGAASEGAASTTAGEEGSSGKGPSADEVVAEGKEAVTDVKSTVNQGQKDLKDATKVVADGSKVVADVTHAAADVASFNIPAVVGDVEDLSKDVPKLIVDSKEVIKDFKPTVEALKKAKESLKKVLTSKNLHVLEHRVFEVSQDVYEKVKAAVKTGKVVAHKVGVAIQEGEKWFAHEAKDGTLYIANSVAKGAKSAEHYVVVHCEHAKKAIKGAVEKMKTRISNLLKGKKSKKALKKLSRDNQALIAHHEAAEKAAEAVARVARKKALAKKKAATTVAAAAAFAAGSGKKGEESRK